MEEYNRMADKITSLTPELLAMRWPSTDAARSWLKRKGTSAAKLNCILGMAGDDDPSKPPIALQPRPADAKEAAKPDKAAEKPAPARRQPAKAAKASKAPAKAEKPAKGAAKGHTRGHKYDALVHRALTLALKESGVARTQLQELIGDGPPLDWTNRLKAVAQQQGCKLRVVREARRVTYLATQRT